MKRWVKQFIIVITVVIFIASIVLAIRWLLQIKPTCFDGVKNGEEEGVDCGGACGVSCPTSKPDAKPIEIKSIQVASGGNKCDVVAIVDNPNNVLGADHIPYEIKWGTIDKTGEFYIYPSEERYIAEMNLACQGSEKPVVTVKEPPKWDLFRGFEKPSLEISNAQFNYPKNSYEFAEVNGTIVNESPFDLQSIEIYAIIKDTAGNITAINKTNLNSLLVGSKRDFRIFWTHDLPKDGVGSFYTTSNLFNTDNFLRTYSAESSKWDVGSQDDSYSDYDYSGAKNNNTGQ